MLCRKKILECERGVIKDIGFIDPYCCNEYALTNQPGETEHLLLTMLRKQSKRREILFPYHVMRMFHHILLIIEPHLGRVEVMDSKRLPLDDWADMQAMLKR